MAHEVEMARTPRPTICTLMSGRRWTNMPREFGPQDAKRFYDRIGRLQDAQLYERPALRQLLSYADFEHSAAVFELGCGTGRLAAQLLAERLREGANYTGIDLSSTMIGIATRRLAPWGKRATVSRADGTAFLSYSDGSFDRFVTTYVLELLSDAGITTVLREAHRLLMPDGKLCVVNSTEGKGPISRLVSMAWMRLYRINPGLVGGCRPLNKQSWLDERYWSVEHAEAVTSWGIASEIAVAQRL
jgi:ubiquinone/menaquinone biosynthesis C-methylase UbiE